MTTQGDIQATLWQVEPLPGVEFLTAAYTRYEFPKHAHDAYVIQVVERGLNRFFCENKILTAPPGCIAVIHPGEVHTGCSMDGQELRYRSFYVQPHFFERFTETANGQPVFNGNLLPSTDLAQRILRAHQAAQATLSPFETQALFYQVMSELLTTHTGKSEPFGRLSRRETDRVANAKHYLREHAAAKVSLEHVAAEVGLSPFHFLRVFQKQTGLSPHEYLLSFRIERARRLLKQKLPIAQVALETGFSDQSHLTRCFKKIVGVTPGRYAGLA